MKKQNDDDSSVHQPHDKLVRKLLSNPATARDILKLYLPKDVLAVVNLNKLELQRDSFIDDEHRAFAIDLLYKTAMQNDEAYIWLLIEQQTKSEYWMPLRLFKYIAIIWDHLAKTKKLKHLPLVYPLIIFNGNRPYTHSLNLSDLVEPAASKEIFKDMFNKPFSLVDLSQIQDETLRQQAQEQIAGIALLMTLKHVYDRQLQTFFDEVLIHILKQLDQSGGANEVVDLLYYLLKQAKFFNEKAFLAKCKHGFSEKVEGEMATIEQQIEQRGREQGLEQGREQGLEQGLEQGISSVAKKMLKEGLGLDLIKKTTSLSLAVIKNLQAELKNKKH